VSSNAATTDVYSAIYIAASNSKQIKIKAHGNIPNLAFVHKKGYYSADVSLSGVCAYGFRTVANGHCYYLTIHDCQLVCSEFVVFNQYNISLDSINAYNNRFEGKRLIQSGVGTWNNSVFENNVFVCNSNAGNLTAINGNFDIKFINNIIDGNGQDITLIMTNGPLTFLNNVFKTALVGNVISGIYGHYNLVGNVFYIEDGAGFNINMANVFAFGNIDMNKKAMLFADALGNSVGTVYPKVIGTPTSGNLAKFNGTNIEDSGQAPAT
jgi:hypothetical protein